MKSVNVERHWYRARLSLMMGLFVPFSLLFSLIISVRRFLYRHDYLHRYQASVPVIVVGNITVGGTGKTPMVIWLAKVLRARGLRPGIVSRGYGGMTHSSPILVKSTHEAHHVGDEVLLLQQRTNCPIVVCPNRVKSVQFLLQMTDCDIVISDDGLQHYALKRDVEIVMVNGDRRFGNRYVLPSGPLREPIKRLNEADFVVVSGGKADDGYQFNMSKVHIYPLHQPLTQVHFSHFVQQPIHAVAGIAHAERFFSLLEKKGLTILRHPFPDHHAFKTEDLQFNDAYYILMTEKDAVKCQRFVNTRCFVISIDMAPNQKFCDALWMKLTSLGIRSAINETDHHAAHLDNEFV